MAEALVEPNEFVLGTADGHTHVTYRTHGVVGPWLAFDRRGDPATAHEGVPQLVESEMGMSATVVLEDGAGDRFRVTLTLLLPRVYLEEEAAGGGTDVATVAVLTRHRQSRERRGQNQHYEVLAVPGTARVAAPSQ